MRFVVAIVLFVVAAASVGYGVAQRTVLRGPSSVTAEVSTASAPITLVRGAVLNANEGAQTITVSGEGDIFMAYGRTADVVAWIGDASYSALSVDDETGEVTAAATTGTEETVPDPAGSDLWIQEFTGVDTLTRKLAIPGGVSVIILSDGTAPAPAEVEITWPLDNSAPLSGPLILGGLSALALGLLAVLWALIHTRRSRGPRRRTPKLPRPPRRAQLKPGKRRGELTAGPSTRSEEPAGTRGFTAARRITVPAVVLVGALALSGCSALEQPEESSSLAQAEALAEAEALSPVAVTESQLSGILSDVVEVVAQADRQRDAKLAATRLAGAALDLRKANYTIRKEDRKVDALESIPGDDVRVMLPQQAETWPRAVFAVATSDDVSVAPMALMLVQESPRENYHVTYAVSLEPETELPDLAPQTIGAPRLAADNVLGLVAPNELAVDYGDLLINGGESDYSTLFTQEADTLRSNVGKKYRNKLRRQLPSTARISFSAEQGPGEVIAFGTVDSGQLVATELYDVETVRPKEEGAAINPTGQVADYLGKTQSTKGIVATYSAQLLFYIPPASAEGEQRVQLLGFAQGLVEAHEYSKRRDG